MIPPYHMPSFFYLSYATYIILREPWDHGWAVCAIEPFPGGASTGVAVGLGDPEASTFIDGEGDGLADVGFGGHEHGTEALGHVHGGDGLFGG